MGTTRWPIVLYVAAPVLALMIGCNAGSPGGGGGGGGNEFNITIENYFIELNEIAAFEVGSAAGPVRRTVPAREMAEPPTRRPTSGQITLDAADIGVDSIDGGDTQGITGLGSLLVSIAAPGAEDPFVDGTPVGTFQLGFEEGRASVENRALALPPDALDRVLTGSYDVGLEMSADTDASVVLRKLGLEFGPAENGQDGSDELEGDGSDGASSGSGILIRSTFDVDHEGWVIAGNGERTDAEWDATGGRPGGCIEKNFNVSAEIAYWDAPAKFLGDLSGAYGGSLTFDTFIEAKSRKDAVLAYLIGGGVRLEYTATFQPETGWTAWSIGLDDTARWKNGDTQLAATEDEIRSVLANLSQLRLRGEYPANSVRPPGKLDNVVLTGP